MPQLIASLVVFLVLSSSLSHAFPGPAERLAEAVRFKTVSYQNANDIDYSEFERFHGFLRTHYPRVFSQLEVEVINGYSLLIRWPGSDADKQAVLFTAHMDVVPVEEGTDEDWHYPAFAGVIADGRIYGRGTLDDKLGVLGLLEAAESLLAEGFSPRRSLVFAFGHDEELSGKQGAGKIAQRMRELGWQFAWMVDEGGMLITDNPLLPGRPVAMVAVAEKGSLTMKLVATAEGGHSSMPPSRSAIGRLSAALVRIEENPFPTRLLGPVEAMLETMSPYVDQPQRFIFSNLWLTGGLVADQMSEDRVMNAYVRTTTALTVINAGKKENVLPQRAEASVNFRLLPGDTPQSVVKYIEAVVDDPGIEISYHQWDNMLGVSDYQGDGYNVIAEAVTTVYPEAIVVPSLLVATTDTRHYVDITDNQYRFHGIMMSVDQASSIHGSNEYIGVESYENSIKVARQMMLLGAR